MPSEFRDPKSLPEWVELDYYRRRRPLRRWLRRLTWGTLVGGALAAVLAAAAFAFFTSGLRTYQAGPVTEPHALWGSDCQTCHTEHWQTATRFWNPTLPTVNDDVCLRCHDGAAHNPKQIGADFKSENDQARNCSGCHREHHGRDALALVPDAVCTACHTDLKGRSARGEKCPFENVTSFPTGHPLFKLHPDDKHGHQVAAGPDGEVRDKANLFFNHKVHLDVEHVWKKGPDAAHDKLALNCGDCHQPDDMGRYMKPVRYDSYCKACHPISVQLNGVFKDDKSREAERAFANDPVPHPAPGQGPEVPRAALRERLARLIRDYPHLVGGPAAPDDRAFPGLPGDLTEQAWHWVNQKTTEAEQFVFWNAQIRNVEDQAFQRSAGCAYCHVKREPKGPRAPDQLPEFEKPDVPRAPWFRQSIFSHERHRMMECLSCHPGAKESTRTSDVLVPFDGEDARHQDFKAKEFCARCHSPGANGGTGARHDCIECHRYHDRNVSDGDHRRPINNLLHD
jgi:hypothetical protein